MSLINYNEDDSPSSRRKIKPVKDGASKFDKITRRGK
jgi:hypothetical protein